jgi:hypothetical protein
VLKDGGGDHFSNRTATKKNIVVQLKTQTIEEKSMNEGNQLISDSSVY